MKMWVDDLREPPNTEWLWVQTSAAAIWYLDNWCRERITRYGTAAKLTIALDHDLGLDADGIADTTRPVLVWLIDNLLPTVVEEITVHSANPVGREWLEGTAKRFLAGELTWEQ